MTRMITTRMVMIPPTPPRMLSPPQPVPDLRAQEPRYNQDQDDYDHDGDHTRLTVPPRTRNILSQPTVSC